MVKVRISFTLLCSNSKYDNTVTQDYILGDLVSLTAYDFICVPTNGLYHCVCFQLLYDLWLKNYIVCKQYFVQNKVKL